MSRKESSCIGLAGFSLSIRAKLGLFSPHLHSGAVA